METLLVEAPTRRPAISPALSTGAMSNGIGPKIVTQTLRVLAAGAAPVPEFIAMGERQYGTGYTPGIAPEARDSLRHAGVLLAVPVTTPLGAGPNRGCTFALASLFLPAVGLPSSLPIALAMPIQIAGFQDIISRTTPPAPPAPWQRSVRGLNGAGFAETCALPPRAAQPHQCQRQVWVLEGRASAGPRPANVYA